MIAYIYKSVLCGHGILTKAEYEDCKDLAYTDDFEYLKIKICADEYNKIIAYEQDGNIETLDYYIEVLFDEYEADNIYQNMRSVWGWHCLKLSI